MKAESELITAALHVFRGGLDQLAPADRADALDGMAVLLHGHEDFAEQVNHAHEAARLLRSAEAAQLKFKLVIGRADSAKPSAVLVRRQTSRIRLS